MPRIYRSSRADILDAAERVILRDGPSRFRIDAVLAEAGVSKGGFFHHFPTKEALFSALLARLSNGLVDRIRAAVARDPVRHGRSLRAQIEQAFNIAPAERDRTQALALALISAASESKEVAKQVRRSNELGLRAATSDGVDPGVALVVQFALDGFFITEALGTMRLTPARRDALRQALLALVAPAGRARGRT